MSTCRDCFHYELCKSYSDYPEEVIKESEKNFEKYGDAEDNCEWFKDKSKIVELPCKVGDEFYIITPSKRIKKKVVTEMSVGTKGIYAINSFSNFYFVSDFGKSVFLTREEAENAFKKQKA